MLSGRPCVPGYNLRMLRLALFAVALSLPAVSHGTEPLIDNERVVVWDTTSALPPSKHDFVSVSLSQLGTAVYGHQGEVPSKGRTRTIVIELKDNSPAPIPNNSGYPLAFPRPHAAKLCENDHVIAWSVQWPPGESTPSAFSRQRCSGSVRSDRLNSVCHTRWQENRSGNPVRRGSIRGPWKYARRIAARWTRTCDPH